MQNTHSTYDSVTYNPVKSRLLESEVETEEQTNHNVQFRAL